MCCYRKTLGLCLGCLGLGMVLGQWFSSWLFCTMLGLGLMALGVLLFGKA